MVAQGDCDGEMRRTADIGIAFQNAVILFLKGTALAVPRKWNGRNRASQASEKLVKSILRGRIVSGHDFSRAVSASESMRASAPEGCFPPIYPKCCLFPQPVKPIVFRLLLRQASDLLQVGEFLHQLFHAVAGKEDRQLGVFAVALAHEDGALAVLRVADALALPEIGCAARCLSRS